MSAPGTFLLTFDVELAWGLFFDRRWRERALLKYGAVREVLPEILSILESHDVRATFAFVGHLLLDRCERVDGKAHPEMPRALNEWFDGDWYDFDPGTDVETDPLWYGPDLLAAVRAARPEHEIGLHGFSHAFLDRNREVARAEMRAGAEVARAAGVEPRSFVYPRNLTGFPEELAPAGLTCYRRGGNGTDRSRFGTLLRRFVGKAPPVGRPRAVGEVVEVPTSLPILPAMGARALFPMASRLREVRRGLERARDEAACYHLWTHPHNFVEGRAKMLRYLDRAMAFVAAARDRGEVSVRTMGEVTP